MGMHPDQATESIIDCALMLDKPGAVVPCCVFPSLFPREVRRGAVRALEQGLAHLNADADPVEGDQDMIPVTSYLEFVAYLLDKDPRMQLHYLPMQGRNKVVYFNPHQ